MIATSITTAPPAMARPMPLGDAQLRKNVCLNRINPALAPIKPPAREEGRSVLPAKKEYSKPSDVPPFSRSKLHLGMFEVGKPLGKGKFGRVYLVKHRPSGFICALKVLDKKQISEEGMEKHVRREIEVQTNLRHPGVLALYGWFHDSRRIFLLIELAVGGELFKVLRRAGRFSERRSAKYAAQVAQALDHLHGKNVIHRDLKPENILIGLHGELKLADFGYSVYAPSNRRDTFCGTLDYLPPEMLNQRGLKYTNAIDQWTLGVLTYEFVVGEAPFEEASQRRTFQRIAAGEMTPLPAHISPEAKDFIQSLLTLDPLKRLKLKDVPNHPWILKQCKS